MMKTTCLSLLFILCLLGSASTVCQGQTYDGPEEEIDAIIAASVAFSQHYMKGDFDKMAASYTLNGAILPPGADIIQGREAIEKRWTLPEGVSISHHRSTPTEITVSGDFAYDIGYYEGTTVKKDGTESSWKGKYLIVWKKVDGKWLIHMDAWNGV
ncbi:DUF4440 domain-containing protein [Roseivirga sp. BDSF3-8]|uniref:YybH family protein n=1 Tax=Roseivirga sp. BDSF3-8 TaxID=3241598 RepID=UPI0035324CDC